MRLPDRAGEPGDRRLRTADPRRADEPEPGQGEARHDIGLPRIGRRDQRDPEVLGQPQRRRVEHGTRLPDRNPVQLPGGRAPLIVGRGDAVPHVETVSRQVHDIAEDVLVGAGEVESGIAVEVLAIEHAVAVGAAAAQVAPGKHRHATAERPGAERQLGDRPLSQLLDRIRPVAQDPDVVRLRIEDADVGALGVEPALADELAAGEDAVGPADGEGVGGNCDGVLAHGAKVHHQAEAGGVGRLARGLEQPELEKVVVAQVDAGGAERGDHRAPARPEIAPRERPPGGVVPLDDAPRRVGVQGQVHDRLGLLAPPGQPDQRIDVLGAQLQRDAVGPGHQVLPSERHRVVLVEAADEADVLQPGGLLRSAAELPLGLAQGDAEARVALELLEIRLAGAVGVGLGDGELGVHVEERGRARLLGHQLVQEAVQPGGLEVQLGVDPADQVGRCLEAERGPGERALLALVHADQIDRAPVAQRVPGGHAEDRRRRHGEEATLLEPRDDLRRSRAEQLIRVEEGDLSHVVRDRVVHPADELPAADEELLAVLAQLERVEAERGPVPAAGGVVLEPERKLGRRPLRQ